VHRHRAQQPSALESEVLREKDDRRRHDRPEVPVREIQDGERAERRRTADRLRELKREGRGDESQDRGDEKDDRAADTIARPRRRRQIGAGSASVEQSIGWGLHRVTKDRPGGADGICRLDVRSRDFVRINCKSTALNLESRCIEFASPA
jgi:hypothetical protein